MTETLRKAPDIISISQEAVPQQLQGHTLIYYLKEKDRVILAGWGEHTALLAKLIREYLEIPANDYQRAVEALRELGLSGIPLELWQVIDRIYQERSGQGE